MNHAKQFVFLFASNLLFISVPLLADTDAHAKDKAFIKNAMQKMDKATQNKDLNGYMQFLHPDYIDIGEGGRVNAHNKAEMKDQLSQMFARATSLNPGHITVTRFVFDKQGATVYESSSLTMKLMVTGQTSVLQTGGNYRDVWVKAATG